MNRACDNAPPARENRPGAAAAPFLECAGLGKRYRTRRGFGLTGVATAVDNVSLCVGRGETLGLVGESGCGKSTLARMIARLTRPSAGTVRIEGRDVWRGGPEVAAGLPRQVQMVFQDPFSSLNPRLKVGTSVAEGLMAQGVGTRASRRERVAELLTLVGLQPEHAGRYPHEFSGGQRQRLAIARALALSPGLIIHDEPVSALDVSIQAQILNLLLDLQEDQGLSYLFISHDLAVVGHMSARIAVMHQGRIVELAPSATLLARPEHPYTQSLLAAAFQGPALPPALDPAPIPQEAPAPYPAPVFACPYAPRCQRAGADKTLAALCRHTPPAWREKASGHGLACHAATDETP